MYAHMYLVDVQHERNTHTITDGETSKEREGESDSLVSNLAPDKPGENIFLVPIPQGPCPYDKKKRVANKAARVGKGSRINCRFLRICTHVYIGQTCRCVYTLS